jgi:hypothetical protein
MINDFDIKKMKQVLYESVSGISQNRFLSERPKIRDEKMNDMVVVSLPYTILKPVYGSGYGSSSSICRIELYARDKAGSEDIIRLDSMLKATISLFPITKDGVLVCRPRVVLSGSDDNGFHSVFVHAEISLT